MPELHWKRALNDMRIKPEQLSAALQKGLMPVYFITGDEPLQLGEMADEVRKAAKKAGFKGQKWANYHQKSIFIWIY